MGGGVEVGRWVRVPTDTERERGLSEGERYKETDREREREAPACLVTVETSPDTPPGRAAKIISAS